MGATMRKVLVLAGIFTLLCSAAQAYDVATSSDESWLDVVINSSGKVVHGSGQLKTEARSVGEFDSIRLEDSSDVSVQVGEAFAVSVTADDNVLPLIGTTVTGHTLIIGSKGSYRTHHGPQIAIQLPRLAALKINGSGDVKLTGLSGGELELAISGSGDINAQGKVERLTAEIEGSGDIDARALHAEDATVSIDGSGDAKLSASHHLSVEINGSGDVVYRGTGVTLDQRVNGSGSVRHE